MNPPTGSVETHCDQFYWFSYWVWHPLSILYVEYIAKFWCGITLEFKKLFISEFLKNVIAIIRSNFREKLEWVYPPHLPPWAMPYASRIKITYIVFYLCTTVFEYEWDFF